MENFAQIYVKLDIFGIFLFKKGLNPKSLVAALATDGTAGCTYSTQPELPPKLILWLQGLFFFCEIWYFKGGKSQFFG